MGFLLGGWGEKMALINCKECGAQVDSQDKNCNSCGKEMTPVTMLQFIFNFLKFPILIIGIMWIVISFENSDMRKNIAQDVSPKEEALKNMDLQFEWSKGGFNNIMMIDITIKNNSNYNIKDFTIKCDHSSNSGTKIDSNERIIYEIVKAGETKEMKEFNMGFIHSQATSSNCKIVDLVVM